MAELLVLGATTSSAVSFSGGQTSPNAGGEFDLDFSDDEEQARREFETENAEHLR